MSAVLSPSVAPPPTLLRLLGPVEIAWQGRRNPAWAYAKLPALLALLGHAGPRPVRREWLAALLWPAGDGASLRRALYDLRRQLRRGRGAPLVESTRDTLRLAAALSTDLVALEAAWRTRADAAFDLERAERALALWQGEFAAGLVVPECDEFDLWLRQARARWQQRCVELSLAVAERHLRAGRAPDALACVRRALEHAPDAEALHALHWRCLVAAGSRLAAVEDWRRTERLLAAQQLAPSPALRRLAADLGLLPAIPPRPAGADDEEALAEDLASALRGGGDATELLQRAEGRLLAGAAAASTTLLRRAFMLRLMNAPWHDAMARLAARAEARLCGPLAESDRLDLVQPLAMWHGWMGRGVRGEVLLRGLERLDDDRLPAATRVRHAITLAMCHSCSTGDPERSIRAARRGLAIARAGAVPHVRAASEMLVANAALNRDAPGDDGVAARALAAARADGPLHHFDLVNHHQLSAQWQLQHGVPAQALAEAEQGQRMALAVPFPLQGLSCTLLAISARMLMGEHAALAGALADATALARRIGSQGYLMNALFISAAAARRRGDGAQAAAFVAEAQAIARACGVVRVRKIPVALLDEALERC